MELKNISEYISLMDSKEEIHFDLETYQSSSGKTFINREEGISHWYHVGKKQGYVYSKQGHHTLLKIIVPTFNEDVLIEPFIQYYGNLIGFENIILFDNYSTSENVKKVYEKYNCHIFYTYSHFDTQYNNDYFDNLITFLKNSCKFICKLDTDEFLCRFDKDRFVGRNQFIEFLKSSKDHIMSYWLENLYTQDIMKNPSDIRNWIYFDDINGFQNDLKIRFGKTLINTSLQFINHKLSWGNHNMNTMYDIYELYKENYKCNIVCLHLCHTDIPRRMENSEKLFADICIQKKYNFELFLKQLKDYASQLQKNYHRCQELYEYYLDKEKYLNQLIHKKSKFLETDIISAIINQSQNVLTKIIFLSNINE